MLYYNADIFTPAGYVRGGFRTEDGRFAEIIPGLIAVENEFTAGIPTKSRLSGHQNNPLSAAQPFAGREASEDPVNLGGAKVLPGLVDIHTHGAAGADFSDGDSEGLRRMAAYLAAHGITSFAPTSMTLPYDALAKAFATAVGLRDELSAGTRSRRNDLREILPTETGVNPACPGEAVKPQAAPAADDPYAQKSAACARVVGIHMEGPFFSEKKKGAQNKDYLRAPDFDAFKALYDGCGGLIRIVDLAPELPGAADFAARARELCTVSVAHTAAGYADAAAVFEAGASHLTHLFNAMPPLLHREPGVIGAASERKNVVAELICDGLHVHPSAVRAAFRLFPGRLCLISDSLRCCGMPDGSYELGGQTVYLKDRVARLADGTIAGSASNLHDCLRNAVMFGIPEEAAIRAATILPAREIGADGLIGSIEEGKYADFIVCGEDLEVESVFIGGLAVR